ncbi:MAG: glycosyltransferase [Jatrophihabitans sp.]
MTIEHIAVVIPARNEELTIDECLRAVCVARAAVDCSVRIVVVLDACRDRTRALVGRHEGIETVVVSARCVGAARAAGIDHVLATTAYPTDGIWLANTDADSSVPPHWLSQALCEAHDGADLVLGTVVPHGVSGALARAWSARHEPGDGHSHVHGANLGVRASTYLAAGGFPAVATAEDVGLVDRVTTRTTARIARVGSIPVLTSGRVEGRSPEGFAGYLTRLAARLAPTPSMAGPSPELGADGPTSVAKTL